LIFVDSNVPMYLVGKAHRHKADALRILDGLIVGEQRLVSDAEVLQKILHRYSAISRLDAIQPVFDALTSLVDEVFPIAQSDVESAKTIVLGSYGLSARDAVHVAVMRSHGITRIMSFDTAFDRFPGLERIG
jgi:hypothetical protein